MHDEKRDLADRFGRTFDATAIIWPGEVILVDNRGVGLSLGETPNRIEVMADDVQAFISALGLPQVDVLGGGMIAQELTLSHPNVVCNLVLVGTGPRGGVGMQERNPEVANALAEAGDDPKTARPFLFFSQTVNGKAEAAAFMARSTERKIDLDPGVSMQTVVAQSEALGEWGRLDTHKAYMSRLSALKHSTLVVNGNNDIMVATVNSYDLSQIIPNAQLIVYPDSGHGSLFQHASLFAQHISLFVE